MSQPDGFLTERTEGIPVMGLLKMSADGDTIMVILIVITFIIGVIFLLAGISNLMSPVNELTANAVLSAIQSESVGGLEVLVGIILILAAVAPGTLLVIIRGALNR